MLQLQKIIIQQITPSDTISEFMEKCNNNFLTISEKGGGPVGATGEKGSQGVPTKPKVPIHIWKKGTTTDYEEKVKTIGVNKIETTYKITDYADDLSNPKYQEGHLIILDNSHVYILQNDDIENTLVPTYAFNMSIKIEDGKNSYVHFKYANEKDLIDNNIITDSNYYDYIGVCSNHSEVAPGNYSNYSWNKINDKNINIEYIDKNTLQGSEFTKKIFSKQITSSSGFIVDSLNTNQEYNKNKVIVGGDNIKIVSEDGFTSVLITSDEINFDETDNLLTNTNTFETLYTNVSLNDNSDTIESSYNEIGYVCEISSFQIITSITELSNSDWNFGKNENGINLIIETFNEDLNSWELYDNDFTLSKEENNTDSTKIYYKINESLNINKYFRFKIIINKKEISINKKDLEDFNILLESKLNYTTKTPDKLVDSEESCVIIGKNEILMCVGGNSGLKIDKNGVYIKKDNDWVSLK